MNILSINRSFEGYENIILFFTGPAPESVTNAIYELTKTITSYSIVPNLKCFIDYCGLQIFKV